MALKKLGEPLAEVLHKPRHEEGRLAEALICAILELAKAVTALALAVENAREVRAVSKIEVKDG